MAIGSAVLTLHLWSVEK